MLALRFRRVGGGIEVLRFSEVTGQRLIDFANQNVVSRLLVSPRYIFSPVAVQTWVQWIDSRDDYKATAISEGQSEDYVGDFGAGRRVLFVLELSCSAEMAVICGSVALRT
ncbi:hypothetical protein LJ656_26980 [Paraburkholderia sp. MMS20-SJTR3]|uniref:Uncharacterized protein n=1 Tax=Paraburkholderia sejongensis TaxID=2886946 RepID=A0ABS8K2V9_9BURK|nr:hypothetical protein [Paraburkholderia sp. MMS20-SJTR3]MCC8396238.1 hypothetical protein [Paraburkholderia sp. MMS20-SJTR3]